MRLRFPLYAKILLWFFLNLLVLALAFYAVVKVQLRLGLDSLLAGRAGDRVQAVGEIIAAELADQPRDQWNGILKRFSSAYRIQFMLVRNDGTPLAGADTALPSELLERLNGRRGQRGQPPPPGSPGERPAGGPGQDPGPEFGDGPGPRPGGPLNPPGPGRGRFVVRTETPVRYWIGIRIPVTDRDRSRPGPGTLLAVSSTLYGGGLLFDPAPWLFAGAGVLVFCVLFWLPLVHGITRSIGQMTRATGEIAEGRFEVRVPERRRDELGALGSAVNRMAGRLAGFVTGQKRFLGDIAHELCAPIARIQMALGILEQRADDKQKPYVEDLREEVQHISGLVNELLSFSKASLGGANIQLQPVPLRALVDEAIHREAASGSEINVEIPATLIVRAEPELLKRALANLIRNALRHAGHAGPITIAAALNGTRARVSVADCGPGVPPESLPQLFDPFYRVDASRNRESGGVGLGLTIVKSCVEACQGTVICHNLRPTGFQVDITLNTSVEDSNAPSKPVV